ncbi:MAG: phosphatidylglycerophosphatase A [Proteobacteria bacterium]|jgi:phosphatidylglycerophosphatase A|nr:phosphatidylglycerophosphatase A [Pseudomonadota bacterium]
MAGKNQTSANFSLRNPVHFFALGFGGGLLKPAPGTWGTLVGVLIYLLLISIPTPVYVLLCVVLFVVGIWLCDIACRDAGVHDHGAIVWDEIVGFLVTMAFVPFSWPALILGFLLFRFFDILKPWPISALDRQVGGGFGVMVDDLLAGLFAGILLWAMFNTLGSFL